MREDVYVVFRSNFREATGAGIVVYRPWLNSIVMVMCLSLTLIYQSVKFFNKYEEESMVSQC